MFHGFFEQLAPMWERSDSEAGPGIADESMPPYSLRRGGAAAETSGFFQTPTMTVVLVAFGVLRRGEVPIQTLVRV